MFDFDLRFIFLDSVPDSTRKVCKIALPSRFYGIRLREKEIKKQDERKWRRTKFAINPKFASLVFAVVVAVHVVVFYGTRHANNFML